MNNCQFMLFISYPNLLSRKLRAWLEGKETRRYAKESSPGRAWSEQEVNQVKEHLIQNFQSLPQRAGSENKARQVREILFLEVPCMAKGGHGELTESLQRAKLDSP